MYKPSIFYNVNMSLQILCSMSFSLNILSRMVPVLGLHRPGKQFELNFFIKKNFLIDGTNQMGKIILTAGQFSSGPGLY